ncbi:hypothetical protein J4457_03395 [Candidatus Woesearchaeota archaeon]|nr:hypothetical protein [Candidatus Woesearchaeota archaeon]
MVKHTALVAIGAITVMILAVILSSCEQRDTSGKAIEAAILPCNHESVDMNLDGFENCEDANILYNHLEYGGRRPFCEPGGQYQDGRLSSLDLISTGMRLRSLGVIQNTFEECLG